MYDFEIYVYTFYIKKTKNKYLNFNRSIFTTGNFIKSKKVFFAVKNIAFYKNVFVDFL